MPDYPFADGWLQYTLRIERGKHIDEAAALVMIGVAGPLQNYEIKDFQVSGRVLEFKIRTKRLTLADFEPGDLVTYVPKHAFGDLTHPACEAGTVRSKNDRFVFVVYGLDSGTAKATSPEDLAKG